MKTAKRLEKEFRPVFLRNDSSILSACEERKVDRIILALDERRGNLPLEQLLLCRMKGIRVEDGMAFTEEFSGKLSVENIYPSSFIFSNDFKRSMFLKNTKRLIDCLLSLSVLVFMSPICLLLSLLIKLESNGPIFYRQDRVGENGKTFWLLKFRSMRVDAEQNGPVWAVAKDPRVTRIGRIIRRLRFDEIPQMVNVLRGEMSFVGPRPERQFFINELEKEIPFYSVRHVTKPGVTGWAQIRYPYGASKGDALEKLKYDLYYIKHMSIFFDLLIIFETIKTALFEKGSR